MNSWEQIKATFNKGDSMVRKLILVNIAVFIVISTINLFADLGSGQHGSGYFITKYFFLPANLSEFVYRPWTLVSYMFAHSGFWHILFNLLWFFYLGTMFQEYLGNKKLLLVYFWGGIAGGLFYLAGMNLLPWFKTPGVSFTLEGASAGVLAVIVGIATLLPNYIIRIFVFDIKLKYIAITLSFISFFALGGSNAGGALAHLGGILFGFFYIRNIRHYTVLDRLGDNFRNFIARFFAKKQTKHNKGTAYSVFVKSDNKSKPTAEEVDAVLDKMNRSGYESLTRSEREILIKASQSD